MLPVQDAEQVPELADQDVEARVPHLLRLRQRADSASHCGWKFGIPHRYSMRRRRITRFHHIMQPVMAMSAGARPSTTQRIFRLG